MDIKTDGLEKNNNEEKVIKKEQQKKRWEKPVFEDVSGKIMAQPYIRFT